MLSLLQEAAIRGEDWFFALVQHSADSIFVIDEEGVMVYANPAASRTFEVPLEAIIGRSIYLHVHPDDLEEVKARDAEIRRSPGKSMTATVRFESTRGEVRTLEVVATNCLDIPEVAGIVINGRDVTERNHYSSRLEESFDAITLAIANMVEFRDPYTAGHQRQVAHVASAIARELVLPDQDVKGLEVASTIHDIGKIAIPAEILTRPGRLSSVEFEIIKTHSQAGSDIVADVPFPWPVAELILQHHERIDGSGYPQGLKGNEIMFGARILAVADVVSAMSAHRPYRPALGLEVALAEVETQRGVLFDPVVVDACLRLFREKRLQVMPSISD